jgi:predicted metal-dependent hydrolase
MNEQVLVAMFSAGIRDHLIDALIGLPEISGFSMETIDGYSREHSQYDLREQVAGFRRLCRVEVLHSREHEAVLLEALRQVCSGSPIRYWITPLLSAGHLPEVSKT